MSINEKAVQVLCGKLRFNSRGEFESRVVEITPAIAADLLSLSVGNRLKKDKHISFLANQITDGKFVLTSNSIGFDEDFNLRDGHHRLNAVLVAGVSIVASVSVGIPADNFKYVDIGIRRSDSDRLQMYSDIKDFATPRAVSIAKQIISSVTGDTSKIAGLELTEGVLRANKAGILFAVENMPSGKKVISSIPISAAIASAFLYVDSYKLESFCSMLSNGNPARVVGASEAALNFRQFLTDGRYMSVIQKNNILSGRSSQKALFITTQNVIAEFMCGKDYSRQKVAAKRNESGGVDFMPIIYSPIIPFTR